MAGGADNQCHPDVAWGGQAWLVVWRAWTGDRYGVRAARIAPTGKVLDAQPLDLSGLHKNVSGAAEPHSAPRI